MADDFLALDDTTLLAQCEVDTFRASGPGGQHRNKTDSAVRLRHVPTGLSAQGAESRSQHENRAAALKRLRARIATDNRRPVDLDTYTVSPELRRLLPGGSSRIKGRHPDFWRGAQELLDLFAASDYSLSSTARHLCISTGQLSRLVTGEPELLRAVNALRQKHGLRPLQA